MYRVLKSIPLTSFDDIPDELVQEILCRLVCKNIELVFQCKCISKRWLHIISSPDFIARCIGRAQRTTPAASLATLVAFIKFPWLAFIPEFSPLICLSSNHPFLTSRSTNFTLNFLPNFLPCYKHRHDSSRRSTKCGGDLYKDLVLCCATNKGEDHSRDYFICNPITKQWVALPPAPPRRLRHYQRAKVAFVCDPYYCEEKEIINAEYTWKVVRLVPNQDDDDTFNVEIFSSKSTTHEWRELIVLPSPRFGGIVEPFVAHKGMLYGCVVPRGGIFELDLQNHHNTSSSNIVKCRLIKLPDYIHEWPITHRRNVVHRGWPLLTVTKSGRLRLYKYIRYPNVCSSWDDPSIDVPFLRAWDLTEVAEEGFEFRWLVDRVPLTMGENINMPFDRPRKQDEPSTFENVDVHSHQHNEDIMYFFWKESRLSSLVTCSISGSGRSEIVSETPFSVRVYLSYPFIFPWWPTPVHI